MGVIIIREMVGTSPRSWSDAARQAVATASKTVRNIQTVDVVKSSAVVRDGEIVARPTGYLSVTFDHRVVDGARAAEFGLAVIRRLEQG